MSFGPESPWAATFELRTYELDHRGRMGAGTLFRFLQDIAETNAAVLSADVESLLRHGLTWVLLRLQLEVARYPAGRQAIRVETWPSGNEGRYWRREFRLFQAADADPFARATSQWSLLDLRKMRPVRPEEAPPGLIFPQTERALPDPFPEIRPRGEPVWMRQFPVRLADIDINRHVHNGRYLEWLLESVPDPVWDSHELTWLAVEFRAPARFGDTVHALTWPASETGAELEFMHIFRATPDGPDLTRAWTVRRVVPSGGAPLFTAPPIARNE